MKRNLILILLIFSSNIFSQLYTTHESIFGTYTTVEQNDYNQVCTYCIPNTNQQYYYNLDMNINHYDIYNSNGGNEGRYEDYCRACEKAGVRPLPIDAWSNGHWDGSSHSFHPKPSGPTGFEDEYWKEHDPSLPIGNGIVTLIIMSLLYYLYLYLKKIKY